jgi:hypothetical protein
LSGWAFRSDRDHLWAIEYRETAEVMKISARTVRREWRWARA